MLEMLVARLKTFKRVSTFTFLLLSLLLLGCMRVPSSERQRSGDLSVELWASTKCADPGESVTFRATVINGGARTFLVELKDQPVFDIVVSYIIPSGRNEIRWSHDKLLTPDMTRIELKPGESRSIEMNWVVIEQSSGFFIVFARFVEDTRYPDNPVRPTIQVNVRSCPGPFGP